MKKRNKEENNYQPPFNEHAPINYFDQPPQPGYPVPPPPQGYMVAPPPYQGGFMGGNFGGQNGGPAPPGMYGQMGVPQPYLPPAKGYPDQGPPPPPGYRL